MGCVQEHATDSQTFDTINSKVVPIVFVPGVMGTRLHIDDGPDWDPEAASFPLWVVASRRSIVARLSSDFTAFPLRDLSDEAYAQISGSPELAFQAARSTPPGETTTVRAFYEKRGWGKVVWRFYGSVLMRMQLQLNATGSSPVKHPVFVHGYDWRGSNRDSGKDLLNTVKLVLNAVPAAKQVVVVTHSMGGLVCRSALLDGMLDKVGGVVHTVQPSCGAPVAYRRFHTGATPELDGPPEWASFDWFPALALGAIQGTTRLEYTATQSGLRGPLELLPSNDYPVPYLVMLLNGLATDNVAVSNGTSSTRFKDIYDVYLSDKQPGLIPSANEIEIGAINGDHYDTRYTDRLRLNVDRARVFHARFQAITKDNAHPVTFSVFGSDRETDVAFDWIEPGLDVDERVIKGTKGDGTVPARSAEFHHARPPTRLSPSFPVDHAACFASDAFTNEVLRCVRGAIQASK